MQPVYMTAAAPGWDYGMTSHSVQVSYANPPSVSQPMLGSLSAQPVPAMALPSHLDPTNAVTRHSMMVAGVSPLASVQSPMINLQSAQFDTAQWMPTPMPAMITYAQAQVPSYGDFRNPSRGRQSTRSFSPPPVRRNRSLSPSILSPAALQQPQYRAVQPSYHYPTTYYTDPLGSLVIVEPKPDRRSAVWNPTSPRYSVSLNRHFHAPLVIGIQESVLTIYICTCAGSSHATKGTRTFDAIRCRVRCKKMQKLRPWDNQGSSAHMQNMRSQGLDGRSLDTNQRAGRVLCSITVQ